MSFLRGSTDLVNLQSDLYAMITGSSAATQRGSGQASNGVTASVSERWVGLDPTNFIVRSQATDPPFTSEYQYWRGIPRFALRTTSTVIDRMGRPTFSGAYNGVTAKIYAAAFVSTNNASPGSLAGTIVTYTLVNSVTGATVASGTVTGWTGSMDTRVVAQGISLTLTLQAGETFVAGTSAQMWLRAYTTTFTDGVDYFPEGCKIAGTPVVSNTTGGSNNYTLGADYEIASEANAFPGVSSTIGFGDGAHDWGGNGACSGIHWKVGGMPVAAGVSYFIPATYQVYNGYFQIPNVVNIGGNYQLTGGPMEFWDPVNQVSRYTLTTNPIKTTLNTTTSYGKLFTGVGQAGSTFVNAWISITADKLVIVLRGDTGQSGLLTVLTFQRYTVLVASDKWPWLFIPDGSVGSLVGGGMLVMSKYNYEQPYYGLGSVALGSISFPVYYGPQTVVGPILTGISSDSPGFMPLQNPNSFDLRWWLYSVYVRGLKGGSNLIGTFDGTKAQPIRGKLQGIFAVAQDNFTSLDELVDGSNTYLLVTPSSVWGTMSSDGQSYRSLAILES